MIKTLTITIKHQVTSKRAFGHSQLLSLLTAIIVYNVGGVLQTLSYKDWAIFA